MKGVSRQHNVTMAMTTFDLPVFQPVFVKGRILSGKVSFALFLKYNVLRSQDQVFNFELSNVQDKKNA